MAVSVAIFSNANSSSKSISVDFVGNVLAAQQEIDAETRSNTFTQEYYFKFTTSARDDSSTALPVKINRRLSELALLQNGNPNSTKRKQSASNTGASYTDIKSMVVDYTYDYVYGHDTDQYLSGCTEQRPMKFT